MGTFCDILLSCAIGIDLKISIWTDIAYPDLICLDSISLDFLIRMEIRSSKVHMDL